MIWGYIFRGENVTLSVKSHEKKIFPFGQENGISDVGRDVAFHLGRSMTWLTNHLLRQANLPQAVLKR